MVKKRSNQETATAVIVDENELATVSEENQAFTDLASKLAKIRKIKGVIGYIIRNAASATIDLSEPEKLVEFAIFSSQVIDSTREISDLFEIGHVESILVEGKENKTLCMNINGNKISILLEKDAPHSNILKKVSL